MSRESDRAIGSHVIRPFGENPPHNVPDFEMNDVAICRNCKYHTARLCLMEQPGLYKLGDGKAKECGGEEICHRSLAIGQVPLAAAIPLVLLSGTGVVINPDRFCSSRLSRYKLTSEESVRKEEPGKRKPEGQRGILHGESAF